MQSKILQCLYRFTWLQYLIVTIIIFLITLPSIVLNNVPFYHVDFVNEYASYIAHGEYMVRVKNPLFFWWMYGSQIPSKIISVFAIMLRQFTKDEFSLFILLTKINFLLQTLIAAFSMLLLTRELFGKNNVLNMVSALSYSLTPYYLSETVLYSARTWAYSLAPLALWIIYKYYRIVSRSISSYERIGYVMIGGIIFSVLLFNPLDSVITIGVPSILLCLAIFAYILFIEANSHKALKYLVYVLSSVVVSLMLSLYFLLPQLYAYTIDWPLRPVHGVSGYEEGFAERYIPSFMEALQAINMEHKYHFTHIWPFRDIIRYPSLTYSLILTFLLGFSLVLSNRIKFRNREERMKISVFYIIVLIGLIIICVSTNKDLYEAIRNIIPYAFYLRKPHRLLIFWNIVISLSPALVGYIITKQHNYGTKSSNNSNYRALKAVFLLTITCIYIFGVLNWAYTIPFSALANYEPMYSSYIKSWKQNVIKHIWECLNMSNPLHRDLIATYVSGIHAFSYNYPGFTDAQDTFMWTKYYRYSPSYKDILSLYGIKYIISRRGLSTSLSLYCESDGIEIKQVPYEVERVYIGYPLLVIGGPNALSIMPSLMKAVGREVLHYLMNGTITLVPIFANSLSPEQFNYSISKINIIVFHNSDLLDLIALQAIYHQWNTPIVDIHEPQKVEEAIKAGWKFFEPKYYGYLAPSGMHDSVYGQVTYGDYALYTDNISEPLRSNFAIRSNGTYILMFRLGRFTIGNVTPRLNVVIESNDKTIWNSTIQIHWLGFRWVTIDLDNISQGNYIFMLTPQGNLYIDNVIITLPRAYFNEYCNWALRLMRSKYAIYTYEPSAYTENLTGHVRLLPVKYSASDPSLGVLLLYNTSKIKMNFHVTGSSYLLVIRYKGTDPKAINVKATIGDKEIRLTEIARSIDDHDWFYILYFLRINRTDISSMLTLEIRSLYNSVYVDFLSLIDINALRSIYSLPQGFQITSSIEAKIGKFLVIFHGVKWSPEGFYFDGVDDYIEIKGSTDSIILNEFTILVLLKVEGRAPQVFVAKDISPDSREWELWWAGVDNHIKGFVNLGKRFVISDSDVSPIIGKYALYGLVYNGSHLKVIVNSKPYGITHAKGIIPNTNAPITIGCRGDRKVFFRGYVLSILIYNRTLNLQELQQISKDPLNPLEYGLVLYLNPYTVESAFNNTNLAVFHVGKIEWNYDLKYNKIISGRIVCLKLPCIVVFAWPTRLPNEWIMKVEGRTLTPVKALYMLYGYILTHRSAQDFELQYNPPTLILLLRAISTSLWLIVSIYIILTILIAGVKHRLNKSQD